MASEETEEPVTLSQYCHITLTSCTQRLAFKGLLWHIGHASVCTPAMSHVPLMYTLIMLIFCTQGLPCSWLLQRIDHASTCTSDMSSAPLQYSTVCQVHSPHQGFCDGASKSVPFLQDMPMLSSTQATSQTLVTWAIVGALCLYTTGTGLWHHILKYKKNYSFL